MRNTRIGTVALVIRYDGSQPQLLDKFSDDREIAALEAALQSGAEDPMHVVYELRERQTREDEEFGDYVEELLSQPFVRPEIQEHGIQWLKSKIRIEEYQQTETQAAQIIAEYAFRLFRENPDRKEFLLNGPAATVRIRVHVLRAAVKPESGPTSQVA